MRHMLLSHTQPPLSASLLCITVPLVAVPVPNKYKHPPLSFAEFREQETSVNVTVPPESQLYTCMHNATCTGKRVHKALQPAVRSRGLFYWFNLVTAKVD